MRSDRARLAPLMLATMASQALIVVLAPTIVAVGTDLGASVGAAGQARTVTAGAAILASAAIAGRIDTVGIPRLLAAGAAVAIAASAAVATARIGRRARPPHGPRSHDVLALATSLLARRSPAALPRGWQQESSRPRRCRIAARLFSFTAGHPVQVIA